MYPAAYCRTLYPSLPPRRVRLFLSLQMRYLLTPEAGGLTGTGGCCTRRTRADVVPAGGWRMLYPPNTCGRCTRWGLADIVPAGGWRMLYPPNRCGRCTRWWLADVVPAVLADVVPADLADVVPAVASLAYRVGGIKQLAPTLITAVTGFSGPFSDGQSGTAPFHPRAGSHRSSLPFLHFRFSMLLLVGDSFAFWAAQRCTLDASICTAGWRGGRIGDDRFRRWAIATVAHLCPGRVLLMVGGNDLAQPSYNSRQLMRQFDELVLGMLAAGAGQIDVFPVPPRTSCRHGVVTVAAYRRRRRLTNLLLRRRFARPCSDLPVTFNSFQPAEGFVGRDGVHPSPAGWQAIGECVNACAQHRR